MSRIRAIRARLRLGDAALPHPNPPPGWSHAPGRSFTFPPGRDCSAFELIYDGMPGMARHYQMDTETLTVYVEGAPGVGWLTPEWHALPTIVRGRVWKAAERRNLTA